MPDLSSSYDPRQVEQRLYAWWEGQGYFQPRVDPNKAPFVIIMPPPNVTGELHLGHGLTTAIEDALIRWHRMLGDPTLWLPGRDHAGIAAQVVVERGLAQQRRKRQELGREKFLEHMWQWMDQYGKAITEQHRRLGASCDWTRERFTLDPGPSRAVRTTFVRLYEKGLIYRGERIISWCPRCGTALSDLEVVHQDVSDYLYFIRYPFADGKGHLTVATTRPETLLGDTAVAVNPKDSRHKAAIGRTVLLPALRRPLPVIADEAVDPSFGTGALKITPGHDPVDFEVGQRHGLPSILAMNFDATMSPQAGPYAGMDRFACRKALLEDLKREDLLEKMDPYTHSVGHCDRCKTMVEPLASRQWFVKIAPLAEPALKAVLDGRIRIVPERFAKVYQNWMENIRDWCISRQLWWGHRIPVWYCQDCKAVTVALEDPSKCTSCGSTHIEQDPDVLDTWFSSALWPHSTLGWPDGTPDLRYFYPTSVMETGYDILFFWVARMIMMGIENTGQPPFHTVYLHGLIRDEHGEKMSKVKGNVLNPLELIDQYGCDAMRFALTTGTAPGNDTRLSTTKLEASRNFANKLWNASRFVLQRLEGAADLGEAVRRLPDEMSTRPLEDRWIWSRLDSVVGQVDRYLGEFELGEAQRVIHDFLWGEYCDWYIELAKLRIQRTAPSTGSEPALSRAKGRAEDPRPVLVAVLDACLRLLHPFMPYVTEEVWQRLRPYLPTPQPDSIMVAAYPQATGYRDEAAEKEMGMVLELIRAIRNARAQYKVEASRHIPVFVLPDAGARAIVEAQTAAIEALARARPITVLGPGSPRPAPDSVVTVLVDSVEAYIPLAEMVDVAAERQRLEKELAECRDMASRIQAKLADGNFTSRAPAPVVDKERQRLASFQERLAKLQSRLAELG